MSSPIPYRPEIDGLRAFAVLAVLLFHVGLPHVPGGFYGVEVFFVISGFLITSLVRAEWTRTGSFSCANFYRRRFRRLFPALLATIACSLVARRRRRIRCVHLRRTSGFAQ